MGSLLADKMNRISHRLSMVFRVAMALSMLFAIAIVGIAIVRPGLFDDWANIAYPQAGGLTMLQIRWLTGLAFGQIALTVTALWALARMFDCLAKDEPLSLEAAVQMRLASRWLLAATLYAMLVQIPASLVASIHLPQGERFIAMALSASHASGVLSSLVLYTVASLQELAARVRNDNRQIV